jgi:hypothetical protein
MTIVKSEIGRRNANDTKFIVTPQRVLLRSDKRARRDGTNGNYRGISKKCGSYFRPIAQLPRSNDLEQWAEQRSRAFEQNLDGEPSWNVGGLQTPAIDDD